MIYRICKYFYLKIKYIKKHVKIRSLYLSVHTEIGKNVSIGKSCHISSGCKIGDNTYINHNTTIDQNVEIGKFCSIAPNVYIAPGNHPLNYVTTHPILYDKVWQNKLNIKNAKEKSEEKIAKTIIGNDVWIGINAIILKGVKIGDGAVIGAGTVVTKDVEPYVIVAGNPAKIIKHRFKAEEIKQLQQIKEPWWNKNKLDIEIMYDINNYLEKNKS